MARIPGVVSDLALATLIALSLTVSGCGFFGDADDTPGATTTQSADPDGEMQTGDSSTTTSIVTESTAPNPVNLSEVSWLINDFDGLIDDQGRVVAEPGPEARSARPSIARAGDGSVYYVLDGVLWRWAPNESGPEPVETAVDEVEGLGYSRDGAIVVNPYGEAEPLVAGVAGRQRPDGNELDPNESFITAPNGITVRVLAPDADVDDLGYVTDYRSPARLQVEKGEEVAWTIEAGGIRAPWLSLVDFDGRFVMMARYPTEPADPMMQHIVYDLDCQSGADPCTRSFWARWGTASLVGPDLPPERNDLNPDLLDLCPTMGVEIAAPAEMTDPDTFNSAFTVADVVAFERAALQLSTCDPLGLGDPEQPGLLYRSGDDDPEAIGWMWTDFARAMAGPFASEPNDTWVWTRHSNGARAVLTHELGRSTMDLMPGRQIPGDATVTVTADAVVVSGSAAPTVAEAVTAAAQSVADDRGIELTVWLEPGGQAHPDDLVGELATTVESMVAEGTTGEVHLTASGVSARTYDTTEASTADQALGFAIADFASGGEGVFPELPLADDMVFALGPNVVAIRNSAELFKRQAWTVNAAVFQAQVGPFNILDRVPSPSRIVVGPHLRCASPLPSPSPPELGSFRRIAILPADDSIDSCLEWSAVDIFVDDDGLIHGISLDVWEP